MFWTNIKLPFQGDNNIYDLHYPEALPSGWNKLGLQPAKKIEHTLINNQILALKGQLN